MNIHQVNSKETMLNENDIVIVAAYMADSSEITDAAKEHDVSPQRLLYTTYINQMQNPALIRIRDGNTLFNIAALDGRIGYVAMYNADVKENVASNFVQFLQAAYKMGFNLLCIKCEDDSLNESAQEIQSDFADAEFSFDEENDLLIAKFNQPHGE
jgi:hypothetical protein